MSQSPTLASYLVLQAENNAWSNQRLYAACAALPAEAYFAKRPCFFGSIHNTLYHLLLVDHRYIDRRLIDLVRGLGAARLAEPVRIVDEAGQAWSDPLHRVLAHLFVHQVHHRGQVHDLLSQTSVAPPQLDEFFLTQDAARRPGRGDAGARFGGPIGTCAGVSATSRPGIVTVKAAHPSDEDAGLTRNPSTIQPPGPRVPGDFSASPP
jgi:uncharacterized damage-inducible protein DinB